MSEDFLDRSLRATDASALSSDELGVHREWLTEKWLMRLRLEQYRADPTYRDWGIWAVGLRTTGQMVGHMGFHTPPDAPYLRPYAESAVELGFETYSPFRRQGIATEAAAALMSWATETHGVTRFVLSISPQNTPSLSIAEKLGFRRIGQWEDDKDGPEEVFLLERSQYELKAR
jgi:RimJ/RimL family protein N-acetyltransferase